MLEQSSKKHLRFLLVEDDRCLETSLSRVLKFFDDKPEVVWTTTGEEAMSRLKEETYDLIIVDYTLAGVTNGLYIWEYCRKKHPNVPFILMSGLPVESFLDLTKGYGNSPRFLPKPFFPNDVRNIIAESLASSKPVQYRQAA